MVCKTGGRGPCDARGITYKIECKCQETYNGQTSGNAYERGRGHEYDLAEQKGPLWEHFEERHGSRKQPFTFSVTGKFGNDAMLRQITEAVKIRRSKSSMNRKEEWNSVKVPHTIGPG